MQDQKELKALPRKIEKLENEIEQLHQRFADPEFFEQDPQLISDAQKQLSQHEQSLEELFARWEALENS